MLYGMAGQAMAVCREERTGVGDGGGGGVG